MKHTTRSVIRPTAFLLLAALFVFGKPVSEPNANFTGYSRFAKTGMTFNDWACGQFLYVYVNNYDEEIAIGTSIWVDAAMTTPFPTGILTSLDGSTSGQSFWVIGGVVCYTTTPINCQDALDESVTE